MSPAASGGALQALLRLFTFLAGGTIVFWALSSAVRTFVLPRSAQDHLTSLVFVSLRRFLQLWVTRSATYYERDRVMAMFAPLGLLALLPTWLALVLAGYSAMFWAAGIGSWSDAIVTSGSSLLTLGFARGETLGQMLLAFSEATIGLILVALLIAYLPTMYGAFSRREQEVTRLEVRAGSPPSAVEMISRYKRLNRLERLHEVWKEWEDWFSELEESHTSLAALVFFRSPQPDHSWVTAAGAVLDAAALSASTLDVLRDVQMDLCIRAGYLALRRIADYFRVAYNPNPHFPEDAISVTHAEFDGAYELFHDLGVPLKADQEQAWLDFAGWRVNYDTVLLSLCALTMAPPAPWSSDRAPVLELPSLRGPIVRRRAP